MGEPAEATTTTRSGVIWKRAGALFIVCMIAVGVLALGIITGAIPTQLVLSKSPFKMTLDRMVVNDMSAYVGNDPIVEGGEKAVVIAGIEGGQADNLCLSTVLDLPIIGDLSIQIKSGGSRTIELERIVAQADAMLIGHVVVKDAELGMDAAEMTRSDEIDGRQGAWGLQFHESIVTDLKGDGEAIKTMSVRLRGLGLGLSFGENHCYEVDE